MIAAAKGESRAALADYNAYFDAGGNEPHEHKNRGDVFVALGEINHAITDYTRAIERDARYDEAYFARAEAYSIRGEIEKALVDATKAVELDPKDHRYFNQRCWLRATNNGDLGIALGDCDKAVALAGEDANNRDSRAFVLLRLARIDDALAEYNHALKIEPRSAYSLFGRAIAHRHKGNTAEADADMAAAKAIKPTIAEEFAKFGVQ